MRDVPIGVPFDREQSSGAGIEGRSVCELISSLSYRGDVLMCSPDEARLNWKPDPPCISSGCSSQRRGVCMLDRSISHCMGVSTENFSVLV